MEAMARELGFVAIAKDRFGKFLLCQIFHPTLIYFVWKTMVYFLSKTLLSPLLPSTTLLAPVYEFLLFQFSFLLFSIPLFQTSSPRYIPGASPIEFLWCLLQLMFFHGPQRLPRVRISFVVYVACSAVSASMAVLCLCGSEDFGAVGLGGFVVGLIYGARHRREVSDFPIVQLPYFFNYKSGILKTVIRAVKLSRDGYLCSLYVLLPILSIAHKGQLAMGSIILEHIVFCCACVVVFIGWELNRHLLEVFLTTRLAFVPPTVTSFKTNPTKYLLALLEDRNSIAYVRNLAYLDLYMVSENNPVDTWRLESIFERTGKIYERVIAVCLIPLEQLMLDLIKSEPFNDYQVCAWCAHIVSSLTVRSNIEKEGDLLFGPFWDSITATITTLLAALLAVEGYILNNPNKLQPANQGPNQEENYRKACSMADILSNSIYRIVLVFHEDMAARSRRGLLGVYLVHSGHPFYGSSGIGGLLVPKLEMFIKFQAN